MPGFPIPLDGKCNGSVPRIGECCHEDRAKACAEASWIASISDMPWLPLVGKLHDEDSILRHQSDQHDLTDLAEDVDGLVEVPKRKECAGEGQGNGEHNDEGIRKLFKLGSKDEVDDDQSQNEGKDQLDELSA